MFPNYKTITKKHSFLFWEWITEQKIEDGWQDLGKINIIQRYNSDGDLEITTTVCEKCYSRTKIGKEKNKSFRYCPLCLEKDKETALNTHIIEDE